ncbi:uncharacterized protein LOC136036401 isoform X2 [Artemia franciscana]|uniref:uncharacterized protein LOC136036401 isoform X2 n=1 Tax=Artemia franciscana TaxID=6661 RepID=UPI0032DBAFE2
MFSNPWYSTPCTEPKPCVDPYSIENAEVGESDDYHDSVEVYLDKIQTCLRPGWTVHLSEGGRLTYCNHVTQASSWIPPAECWDSASQSSDASSAQLPYGWEAALDRQGKTYYINHLNKTTTYEDPRKDWYDEPPQPRDAELQRHPEMGFGFVAGSEKPVIVRFVTEGGPSQDKLLPGDQIWKINGEDVHYAPRDHVISLIKSCKESVQLTVCQPPLDNSARKSALLSAAKKARLKSHPSRVRFAEGVVVSGSSPPTSSSWNGSEYPAPPIIPNVLKVYLENGQTKSFKYDSSTTVADVVMSLQQKLGIKVIENFGLYVEHIRSLRRNRMTLLDPAESLARIAAKPGAQNLRCLFRIAFVPTEAYDLLKRDPVAFEYLYVQCCNDVVQERFAPELQYDLALKLAALHIQQYAAVNSASPNSKLTIKHVEREFGLERFVPASLLETMKRKELHKLLSHNLKSYSGGTLTSSGRKPVSILQAKLMYLQIVRELPSYGAKCFPISLQDNLLEAVILVSPKYGVSQISGFGGTAPVALCDIEDIASINAKRADDSSQSIEIRLKEPKEPVTLNLEDADADELVLVLRGYHRLFTDKIIPVTREKDKWADDKAPPYHTRHTVLPTSWSFLPAKYEIPLKDGDKQHNLKHVDLSLAPSYYLPPAGYQVPYFDGRFPESDAESGMSSISPRSRSTGLDKNMNKQLPNNNSLDRSSSLSLYDNENTTASNMRPNVGDSIYQVPVNRQSIGFDEPSVVSIELLETNSKNEEAVQRVSELKRLVEDAENYLTDTDDPRLPESLRKDPEAASLTSDISKAESDSSLQYGRLKHSDSLLLLNHNQKFLPKPSSDKSDTEGPETCLSDCESVESPQESPIAKQKGRPNSMLKPSDSSFGLHSPDVLPQSIAGNSPDIKDLMKRLQGDPTIELPEGTLYLDPDIIDLTMLPPPITPDEENLKSVLNTLNTPPTPFADKEILNGEFDGEPTNTKGVILNHRKSAEWEIYKVPCRPTESPIYEVPTQRKVSSDIDVFIKNVTIPPPPPPKQSQGKAADVNLITTDDISAFIIPPPPSSGNNDSGLEVLRRLYEAKEGIFQVIRGDGYITEEEQDCGVAELRIGSERVEWNSESRNSQKQCNFPKNLNQSTMQKQDSTQSLNSNSSASSGYASLRPSPQNREPPNLPSKTSTSPTKSSRHSSLPIDVNDIPPPPPPRAPIGLAKGASNRVGRYSAPNIRSNSLTRSSSQGDLIDTIAPLRNSQIPTSTLTHRSQSSEPAIRVAVPGEPFPRSLSPSPSKSSVTSSSGDSLGSNASVATVKEVFIGNHETCREEKEESPPLPPRTSPKKEMPRPPLPSNMFKESRQEGSIDSDLEEPGSPKPIIPMRIKKPITVFSAPNSPQRIPIFHSNSLRPEKRSPSFSFSTSQRVSTLKKPGSLHMTSAPLAQPEPSITPIDDYKTLRALKPGRASNESVGSKPPPIADDTISVDSGSYDQDSLDVSDIDFEALFSQAEDRINRAVLELGSKRRLILLQPSAESEKNFHTSREKLLNDSCQFVTASKLFVKSATESAGAMALCLNQCLNIMDKMRMSAVELASAPGPLQLSGAELCNKVKDVAQAFLMTINVAKEMNGRSLGDPVVGKLMNKATSLAGVLTVLMRALRPSS